MSKVKKFDLDDESVKEGAGQATFFKGKKAQTQRICILDTASTAVMTHWHKGTTQYVLCLNDFDDEGRVIGDECPACRVLGTPRRKHGLFVVWYETTKRGEPIVSAKKRKAGSVNPFEIAVWSFGDDKFCAIRAYKREHGDLRTIDFKVECLDEQFQRLTLIPCKSALWMETKAIKAAVVTEYRDQKEARQNLERLLAREFDADEMIEELGLDDEEVEESDLPDLDATDNEDEQEDDDSDEEPEAEGEASAEEEGEEAEEEGKDDEDDEDGESDLDKALADLS